MLSTFFFNLTKKLSSHLFKIQQFTLHFFLNETGMDTMTKKIPYPNNLSFSLHSLCLFFHSLPSFLPLFFFFLFPLFHSFVASFTSFFFPLLLSPSLFFISLSVLPSLFFFLPCFSFSISFFLFYLFEKFPIHPHPTLSSILH